MRIAPLTDVPTHRSTPRPGRIRRAARPTATAIILACLLALPLPLAAQASGEARAANLAINGALGAVTASVRQVICGCFTWKGVAQGAAGGALMGAGKQIAGTRLPASGLVGRQVNALGVSAIASVGRPHPVLLLPLGPVTFDIRPGSGQPTRLRVDVTDLVMFGVAALDSEMSIHWPSTVSAGAPVVLHSRPNLALGHEAHGFAVLGTVFIKERFSPEDRRRLVSHESIHVLQWDALRQLATHPAERVVVRQIPGVRIASGYLDVGLLAPAAMFLIGSVLPYGLHPWEREAYLLANGGWPDHGSPGDGHVQGSRSPAR